MKIGKRVFVLVMLDLRRGNFLLCGTLIIDLLVQRVLLCLLLFSELCHFLVLVLQAILGHVVEEAVISFLFSEGLDLLDTTQCRDGCVLLLSNDRVMVCCDVIRGFNRRALGI